MPTPLPGAGGVGLSGWLGLTRRPTNVARANEAPEALRRPDSSQAVASVYR